ncbi:hypothetical protein G3M81_12445 [Bacillus paralicheniformis]|uniref:hypothetical protein n=1 Tax=Bacillus TaxID=1386 RepID=UPI0013EF044C|nr:MULTISPECIES: hypothetical protein [Bacillus]MCY8609912.1 hypothetical protein [Bacillus haynesii]MEC0752147.1 hypothetical protein [Bacillus haynesii]QII49499.1 hypothetical protein G3M81_12445 [Bacillus paralicheniformis]
MVHKIDIGGKFVFVIGQTRQAGKVFWDMNKNRYVGYRQVRICPQQAAREYVFDGFNPSDTVIVLVGEWWLNPLVETPAFNFMKNNGAVLIFEK